MFEKIYEVSYYNGFELRDTDLFTDLDLAIECFIDYKGEACIFEYPLKEGQLLMEPVIEKNSKGGYDCWGKTGEYVYDKVMKRLENDTK